MLISRLVLAFPSNYRSCDHDELIVHNTMNVATHVEVQEEDSGVLQGTVPSVLLHTRAMSFPRACITPVASSNPTSRGFCELRIISQGLYDPVKVPNSLHWHDLFLSSGHYRIL